MAGIIHLLVIHLEKSMCLFNQPIVSKAVTQPFKGPVEGPNSNFLIKVSWDPGYHWIAFGIRQSDSLQFF